MAKFEQLLKILHFNVAFREELSFGGGAKGICVISAFSISVPCALKFYSVILINDAELIVQKAALEPDHSGKKKIIELERRRERERKKFTCD